MLMKVLPTMASPRRSRAKPNFSAARASRLSLGRPGVPRGSMCTHMVKSAGRSGRSRITASKWTRPGEMPYPMSPMTLLAGFGLVRTLPMEARTSAWTARSAVTVRSVQRFSARSGSVMCLTLKGILPRPRGCREPPKQWPTGLIRTRGVRRGGSWAEGPPTRPRPQPRCPADVDGCRSRPRWTRPDGAYRSGPIRGRPWLPWVR